MRNKVAKRLRKEAVKLAPTRKPGYLRLKNRTVYKKNEKRETVYDKVFGTIINHPESIRAKYQGLKRNYKKKS